MFNFNWFKPRPSNLPEKIEGIEEEDKPRILGHVVFRILDTPNRDIDIVYDWDDTDCPELSKAYGDMLYMINRGIFFKHHILHLSTDLPEERVQFAGEVLGQVMNRIEEEDEYLDEADEAPIVDSMNVLRQSGREEEE
jgi:hypothetical protein